MKKIAVLFMCLLLVAVMAVPAMAAGSASVSTSDSTPYRGDTFTVTVSVSTEGIKGGQVEVDYGTGLELVEYEFYGDPMLKDFDLDKKIGVFTFGSEKKMSGTLIKFTFKVKSDAKFASNSISITVSTTGKDSIDTVKTIKVTVTCNHKYGAWSASGDKHTHKCSICGATESKAHTYDNLCDTDCNDCGATRVTEHTYAEEWLADETGHWHECVNCQAKSETEAHLPGAEAGEYTDQTCTACGIVLTPALGHQHSYDGTYKTDGNFHWTKCLSCGEETEKVLHAYESDCDDTCDACEHKRAVAHNAEDSWHCDDNVHWKSCVDCGIRVEEGEHTWDAGTVTLEATMTNDGKVLHKCTACSTEKTEIVPAMTFTEALPWWMWLLIGGIGGAVIVLIIQGIVLVAKGSKEN